ncbi:2-succinyl-5-enolpyruvyl-6-hydroxy-3-cyclohexene-1-carboxylic-acid synthase [Thiohalobacter sp. IOR34]|uniref:2-succinyl-5-enolpyruvyl-6-hydroxy-3- cyclohexene-1-carboxylic-acid synthase n=1 Tax=Thiohalobacter sp. IOR34 TaxID=3057176 RepID=UPI0025B21F17|nr:2-succinyl-5-enolpyruvyl-6-hydroxy-3-cyclohexene-1-carboxylic-acid synthase [Thiohalobacter sp. IOR34]WJW75973.1 2-succinyl-5-enolpyruvyl-6-hydroxy-3-cyclohexene-1-carboxylic-acid synthase [Thiohalobacter sp. IOR34]
MPERPGLMNAPSADRAALNLRWAYALLDGLAAAGTGSLVISPGARSTPLTLAAIRHPGLETHLQIDERSAAFFALGLARAQGRPVALVATSGSAPAHWHPAVIEADRAGVPLLLLSADRPPEQQDCGANQTVDQLRLFGTAVRGFHQAGVPATETLDQARALGVHAAHQAQWPLPGPVHVNLPFREPLVPGAGVRFDAPGPAVPVARPQLRVPEEQLARVVERLSGHPGLIVCGPGDFEADFAAAVTTLAAHLDCPLLADPLSGLRFGSHDRRRVLCHYDAFLRRDTFHRRHRPAWVLRFGAMPVSRALLDYLEGLAPGALILVEPHGRWPDPLHRVGEMVRASPAGFCRALAERLQASARTDWTGAFLAEEARAAGLAAELAKADDWFEAPLLARLLERLPGGAWLFSGNSLPIRDLDSFSGSGPRPLRLLANRGASGIDGNIATLLGLAAAAPAPVTGLIGDLAFAHDHASLLGARNIDATLIVINNGGGGIFRQLPQAGLPEFAPYWLTPPGLEVAEVARCHRLPFWRVADAAAFEQALGEAGETEGVRLIEAIVDPELSLDRRRAYWAALADSP